MRRYPAGSTPEHFDVVYRINPWMDPDRPTGRARALRQWQRIVDAYRGAGHEVVLVDPVEGLPDMVFTANAGLVLGGRGLVSRFRHPERAGEQRAFHAFFDHLGSDRGSLRRVVRQRGEGDYLPVGGVILGGSGFRD